MKRLRYKDSLSLRLGDKTRTALELLSESRDMAMAELAREILVEGLRARGIEC
jgi:hypothetical protein